MATGKIPAFQLAAMTFAIGALVGCLTWIGRARGAVARLRQPPLAWIVGVGGLFGYHALYFLALRFAPPAEAGLLNYLWPLLIVLFSSLLPGERLAPHHIIGALLGLAGTVLLFAGNGAAISRPARCPDLIAAFVAAFVWAAYSVMSRRLKAVPTDAVAGFCLATALLAALVHGLVETTVWPDTAMQWLAIIALGVGPVGAAFYAWDIGMKRGDIRVLGAASYATPLLSTSFSDSGRLCETEREHRDRRRADRRRRPDRGEGYVPEALAGRHPSLRRQFEFRKIETGRDRASDQRPVAGALGRLPGLRRHDRLRRFAGREIGTKPDAALAGVIGNLQASARCRRNSARSPPHRCDASASARRAPAGNRSRWKARVRRHPRGNRERSRDSARLRGAAANQVAR